MENNFKRRTYIDIHTQTSSRTLYGTKKSMSFILIESWWPKKKVLFRIKLDEQMVSSIRGVQTTTQRKQQRPYIQVSHYIKTNQTDRVEKRGRKQKIDGHRKKGEDLLQLRIQVLTGNYLYYREIPTGRTNGVGFLINKRKQNN